MRKPGFYILIFLLVAGCERIFMEKDPADTPVNNFEILWETLDRKYAYFEYKGIDWDSLYRVYQPLINNQLSDKSLYIMLANLILELKDAHTDLKSPYGVSNYNYYDGIPVNFDRDILQYYLAGSEQTSGPLTYSIIDGIGYIYIPTFANDIPDEAFENVMLLFKDLKGIIIDVRNNGGGNDANSDLIARHFYEKRRLVETVHLKLGPDHDQFGTMPVYLEPGGKNRFYKPVVVITNRRCFSACNSFVSRMSLLPHVRIVGDTTGGGGGTPYAGELPNGWTYRFSSTIIYRADGLNTDLGIPPDYYVEMSKDDKKQWKDSILEFALNLFN